MIERIREVVGRQLAGGRPPIRTVAAGLNLSVRTLQRRLADAGWTYQGLVDDVRFAVARRRVASPNALFKAVAIDLGFAEQASFTRAFRRWSGLSPAEFRRRASVARGLAPRDDVSTDPGLLDVARSPLAGPPGP